MVSPLQTAIAVVILLSLVGFVAWLNIVGHRERKRRAALPADEQKRLKEEDAEWLQRYGF